MKLEPGATINEKYRLIAHLGAGGFGEVWLAEQLGLERRVAIKFLKMNSAEAQRRFAREAAALAALDHPSCVVVFDFGVSEQRHYLVTAFVDGPPLHVWMSAEPAGDRVRQVAAELADAIAHAHKQGIVHRDIKPANILITQGPDGNVRPMLLDFGLARLTATQQTDITETGEVIGTPGFMSPEQLRGREIGPASDVYSFGVVLYWMLTGVAPFKGDTQVDLAMQHLTSSPRALPDDFPDDYRGLLESMLSKSPVRRPPIARVSSVLRGELMEPTTRRFKRDLDSTESKAPAVIIAAALVILAILAGIATQTPEPAAPPPPRTRAVHALLEKPDAGSVAAAAPEQSEGPEDVGVDAALPPLDGCGRRVIPGSYWIRGEVGYRVPRNYDPMRRAPVILMLHDVAQPANDLLKIPPLNETVDREGFVLIAPNDNDINHTWLTEEDLALAKNSIALVAEELCLDRERIFIIGHGNGGGAGERLACTMDGIVAMAQTSYRLGGEFDPCNDRKVPTIVVSMLDDPSNPLTGPDCLDHMRWSLDKHEREVAKAHGCKGRYRKRGPECQTLRCETPLRLCHPPGGRDWDSMRRRFVTNNPVCNSPAGDFDFVGEIWSFFERVSK